MTDTAALASSIDRLARSLRRAVPAELSVSSLSALERLHTRGPLRVSALAEAEAMTQPGVTLLVNRLAGAGYAERIADPTDRRAALVRITAAGSAVLAARLEARAQALRERLGTLDAQDQRLLAAALPAIDRLAAAGMRATVAVGARP